MLRIETKGDWRQMGRQVGEQYREHFVGCMERWCPWFVGDPDKYAGALRAIEELLQRHCPDALEETEGMAEGAELPRRLLLGYRFYPEIARRRLEGCSAVFLAESDCGPLLGRNCDLNEGDGEWQLLQIARPRGGPAALYCTYLGLAGGVGLNEHGFALGGASAHTHAKYDGGGRPGLPGSVLCRLMRQRCRTVADAREFMAAHSLLGKSANMIAADASGDSVLFEMASGRTAVQCDRPPGKTWQGCTNFFLSGQIPMRPDPPESFANSYARYGRMAHQLDHGLIERSVAGLQRLLTDIANPGMCCPTGGLHTAYSHVMDLSGRKMHLAAGHPAQAPWEEISL